MLRALFPGSFDPPTNGHLDIIRRSSTLVDMLFIVIAVNPLKQYVFSSDERLDMLNEMVGTLTNVTVHVWKHLIVDFARNVEARVIIRGVRALGDFEHEFELSMINRGLDSQVETILIPTDPSYFVLRSTAIKELTRLGGDISSMVPPNVARRLIERLPS